MNRRFSVVIAIAGLVLAGLLPRSAHAALPYCPVTGATLNVIVNNRSGASQSVTITGTLITAACDDAGAPLPSSYSYTQACSAGSGTCKVVTGLEPGLYNNTISVTVAGQPAQAQAQKSVVIASTGANTVNWTVFKTVLPVDMTNDSGSACPTTGGTKTCSFRQALSTASGATKPVLIQFDSSVFPAGSSTTVTLSSATGMTVGADTVIDATDPNGNPTFRGEAYYRTLQLPGTGAGITFNSTDSYLKGLSIVRPTLSYHATPGDIIAFDGSGSKRNHVQTVKIDGGGGSLVCPAPTPVPSSNCGVSQAHDCIEAVNNSGGTGFGSDNNVVETSELFYCPDKAVKSASESYLSVRDSNIHNNLDAGIQATLSGNVEALRNIVEKSGYNSTTQVNTSANGMAANGGTVTAHLNTNGNIVRTNSQRGISVQELSVATITNDVVCGNSGGAGNGIAVLNAVPNTPTPQIPASASVRGTTMVYNARNGGTVSNSSTGDFGTNASNGKNALMYNNKGALGGHDFTGTTGTNQDAIKNEWIGTGGTDCGSGSGCTPDVSQANTTSVLPFEDSLTTGSSLTFTPNNPKALQLGQIYGSGFNAVESYPSGSSACSSSDNFNTCPASASRGVCVELEVESGSWVAVSVKAVTPTTITYQMPNITCSKPITARVTQMRSNDSSVDTATGTLCTN